MGELVHLNGKRYSKYPASAMIAHLGESFSEASGTCEQIDDGD